MRPVVGLVALLLCAGCVAEPPPPPPPFMSNVVMTPAVDNPNCREYKAQATIGNQQQPIVGRACLQSDGTWRVVEGTPQNPNQTVTVYPPYPYSPGYPYPYDYYGGYGYPDPYYAAYYDPWYWGPPIGFSVGTTFFVGGHEHHGEHHGHGGGSHHAGGHGGGGHHG